MPEQRSASSGSNFSEKWVCTSSKKTVDYDRKTPQSYEEVLKRKWPSLGGTKVVVLKQ